MLFRSYISKTTYRYLANAVTAHYGYHGHVSALTIDNMKHEMRKEGFTTLKDTGRDELFIVADSRTKIVEDKELTISNKESASRIARELTKMLSTKKTSRIY